MSSGLAWLSSSSAEIARARAVLKALTPGGVIDELGFLMLQGAFADYFYPAVTTPMTRARYLIFVPAIYQYLEQSGKSVGRDVDRLSRDLQYELLKRLKDEVGAIGKEAGWNVARPPSDIYWSALGTLGLTTQRISEPNYQKRLSAGVFRPRTVKDDDEAAHPDESETLWDSSLRLAYLFRNGTFPDGTSFRLRRGEASLLLSRYEALQSRGHASLIVPLVSIARRRGVSRLDGIDSLWDLPGLPPEIQPIASHARLLSLFARGTTLQYYQMLIEKKRLGDPAASNAFKAWWEFACQDLRRWDVDAFFALVSRWNADKRPLHDRDFLRGWIGRCVSASRAIDALNDADARRIVGQREDRVRPGKQRLRVKYQLDSWRLPHLPVDEHYQLQYRHSVGRRFAEDIADGLERGV